MRWGVVLGSERSENRVRARLQVREHAGRTTLARRRPFREIVSAVERIKREPWAMDTEKGRVVAG